MDILRLRFNICQCIRYLLQEINAVKFKEDVLGVVRYSKPSQVAERFTLGSEIQVLEFPSVCH